MDLDLYSKIIPDLRLSAFLCPIKKSLYPTVQKESKIKIDSRQIQRCNREIEVQNAWQNKDYVFGSWMFLRKI